MILFIILLAFSLPWKLNTFVYSFEIFLNNREVKSVNFLDIAFKPMVYFYKAWKFREHRSVSIIFVVRHYADCSRNYNVLFHQAYLLYLHSFKTEKSNTRSITKTFKLSILFTPEKQPCKDALNLTECHENLCLT